eukprot:9383346-Pyramimonas_sp.AAC.1
MACLGGSRPPPLYYEIWSTCSRALRVCWTSLRLPGEGALECSSVGASGGSRVFEGCSFGLGPTAQC